MVSVLLLVVVAGLNAAVTPAGKPVAVRLAPPPDAVRPLTAIVLLALAPAFTNTLLGEADRVMGGTGITSEILVELFIEPDVPLMAKV
jgi:hypothetical protein